MSWDNIIKPISELDEKRIRFGEFYLTDSLYAIQIDDTEAKLICLGAGLVLKEVVENLDDHTFSYKLRFRTTHGNKTAVVGKGSITEKGLDALKALGYSYLPKKEDTIVRYLLFYEETAKTVVESSFLGFRKNVFWGYPKELEDKKLFRPSNSIKLQKSEHFHKEELNNLLSESPMLQLAVVAGASSATLGFLGQVEPLTTPIIHFFGDSSVGKTTGLVAAASVWGKPDVESGLLSTWNQTELSLMQRLANNFGVAVALDESSICRFDLTSTIYNLSQGVNRQRLSKSAQPAATKQWLTTILSSGESSLLEHTNQNSGLKARVLEFDEPITVSAEHSSEVKRFCRENYGHIGSMLASMLEHRTPEEMQKAFRKEMNGILKQIPDEEFLPITERLAEIYAVFLVTARMLGTLGIDIDITEVSKLLLEQHSRLTQTFDLGEQVADAICSRTVLKQSMYPNKDAIYDTTHVEGYRDGNKLILLAQTFDNILKENNFSSRLVCLRALEQNGVLLRQREDTFYAKRIIHNMPVKVLVLDINKMN